MWQNDAVRRLRVGVTCLGASMLLSGCLRHHAPPTLPAVIQAPIVAPAEPEAPVMPGELAEELTTAPPVKVTQARPRRPQRRPASKNAQPEALAPVDTASAGAMPEDTPIGELSDGGDANPQTLQDAAELITSSERRLAQLPSSVVRQQQVQLRKVRYFLKQARQALNMGDAEGARTLATKAKLLIDDLVK